jgi:hypothetical protein
VPRTDLLTSPPSAGYIENTWAWVADHDIDAGQGTSAPQINVTCQKGVEVSSSGPTWFMGVASEHSAEYQFDVSDSQKLTMLEPQTETPYWQSPPTAWMIRAEKASDLLIMGAVGENWFHSEEYTLNTVSGCKGCHVFSMNTRSSKAAAAPPNATMMGGDHVIAAVNDTGFCSNYVYDEYA